MIALREASVGDLDVLLALDRACFARPWTASQWRDELEGTAALRPLVLLAFAGDEPLGHASAPLFALDRACELRRIGVVPHARGQGLGGDLIACVIDHARSADCARVQLEVASDNHPAIALYQRMGFRRVGLRPRYYRDPVADAVLMDLEIAAKSPF